MTMTEYEPSTQDYSPTDDAPKPRRTRRPNPRPAMHTDPNMGPVLAAEVRLHADNVEADAAKDGADMRITAARVSMLRRWAAEIEAGLESEL